MRSKAFKFQRKVNRLDSKIEKEKKNNQFGYMQVLKKSRRVLYEQISTTGCFQLLLLRICADSRL